MCKLNSYLFVSRDQLGNVAIASQNALKQAALTMAFVSKTIVI